MKNKVIVGIDVSKKVLDAYILSVKYTFTISNDPEGFAQLVEIVNHHLKGNTLEVVYCFEDTGRYSRPLAVFLQESQLEFIMLNALDLKRSLGIIRGKTDRKDARMIALYAWRKRDELSRTSLPGPTMDQLRQLLSLREMTIKHRTACKNSGQDLHDCYEEGENEFVRGLLAEMCKDLDEQVQRIEERIYSTIESHPEVKANYTLLMSVRGIGKVLAAYLILLTQNFTRFTDPKKFACYSGIAPFEYSSGSSVRKKSRVHACANRQIKTLLNLAAMSSIQLRGEYRTYYERRVEEGKSKMSTLNIIRNKLVFRAFAVVKRGTPYVDLTKFAA